VTEETGEKKELGGGGGGGGGGIHSIRRQESHQRDVRSSTLSEIDVPIFLEKRKRGAGKGGDPPFVSSKKGRADEP